MKNSKIFGNKELALLENRIKGNKQDLTGQYARLVKPKVIEILLTWLPRKKELSKLIKVRR